MKNIVGSIMVKNALDKVSHKLNEKESHIFSFVVGRLLKQVQRPSNKNSLQGQVLLPHYLEAHLLHLHLQKNQIHMTKDKVDIIKFHPQVDITKVYPINITKVSIGVEVDTTKVEVGIIKVEVGTITKVDIIKVKPIGATIRDMLICI